MAEAVNGLANLCLVGVSPIASRAPRPPCCSDTQGCSAVRASSPSASKWPRSYFTQMHGYEKVYCSLSGVQRCFQCNDTNPFVSLPNIGCKPSLRIIPEIQSVYLPKFFLFVLCLSVYYVFTKRKFVFTYVHQKFFCFNCVYLFFCSRVFTKFLVFIKSVLTPMNHLLM